MTKWRFVCLHVRLKTGITDACSTADCYPLLTICLRWCCYPLHNVYFVQYIYLAIKQAETYRKSCSLIYLLTYICPSAFDCEVNAIFRIFVKSNSKSGRFSSFLMPNNLGTGQKRLIFQVLQKTKPGSKNNFYKRTESRF